MPRLSTVWGLTLLLFLATPVLGLTGWWTWAPHGIAPHFAFQDPGSGDILHSACNSNGTAIFPTDEPHKFPIKVRAKPATPLAVAGWWDDDLETTIASISYQGSDSSLINAYLECNYQTGDYEIDPEGEYKFSKAARAPSVHEKTGLSVVELGDAGGSRVFYHDEESRVNLLAYDDDTDWQYRGPLFKKSAAGMSLASVQTAGVNVSVVFPHNSANIAVAQFNQNGKEKWTLSSLPTPFQSPAPTNKTEPTDITLDSSQGASFLLPSFDASAVSLGVAADLDALLSIYYIGTDHKLYRISETGKTWKILESPGEKLWPEADDESARLALVSPLESNQVWIYYYSGGHIMELYQDEDGTWAEPKKPLTMNETAPAPESSSNSGKSDPTSTNNDEESQGGGLSTGAKAGIGVGTGVGVCLLLLVGVQLFRIRKMRKAQAQTRIIPVNDENKMNNKGEAQTPQELPSDPRCELTGDIEFRGTGTTEETRAELDTTNVSRRV